jgi:hypothetical protein
MVRLTDCSAGDATFKSPYVFTLRPIESNRRRKREALEFVGRAVEGAGTKIGWLWTAARRAPSAVLTAATVSCP